MSTVDPVKPVKSSLRLHTILRSDSSETRVTVPYRVGYVGGNGPGAVNICKNKAQKKLPVGL